MNPLAGMPDDALGYAAGTLTTIAFVPAGTYTVRLTTQEAGPAAVGVTESLERWVEFVQGGSVKGREVVSIVPQAEVKNVVKDPPPAAGGKRQVHNELALPKRISSAGTTDQRVQAPHGGATTMLRSVVDDRDERPRRERREAYKKREQPPHQLTVQVPAYEPKL